MGTNGNGRGVHHPAVPGTTRPSFLDRVRQAFIGPTASPLDSGLSRINERLGLQTDFRPEAVRAAASAIRVEATERMSRNIYYAPDMDGQAEPGEVVWIWAPSDGPDMPPRERAMLVIGRDRHTILGLLISPNPRHEGPRRGSTSAPASGTPPAASAGSASTACSRCPSRACAARALFPQRRFERIANRLRTTYRWG